MSKKVSDSLEKKKAFDLFQLEEYKNISTSHYESVKQVSTFFRYYLLLLSAPALALTVIGNKFNDFFLGQLEVGYYNTVFFYLLFIAIAGFCLFLFIVNIRHDSILYARKVNKVRKYFYEKSQLSIKEYESYLGLPTSSSKPSYLDKTIFLPLILVFAFINTGLLLAAFHLRRLYSEYIFDYSFIGDVKISSSVILLGSLFLFTHFVLWILISYSRENNYLKSYSFGIDIDGVLNNQTEQFIFWLNELRNKEIKSKKIKEIPVHLNKKLQVQRLDEEVVFNCKEYWDSLTATKNAFKTISDIHKKFGYNISIYTYRPWGEMSEEAKNEIISTGNTPLKKGEISKITKSWLKKNGLNVYVIDNWFDSIINYLTPKIFRTKIRLTIEKGNSYITDERFSFILRSQTLLLNRFQGSKSKSIKFFVEDTAENAVKLSGICEYVFLFDQPYNRSKKKYIFPKNVIRVKSWDDIYSWLKDLS